MFTPSHSHNTIIIYINYIISIYIFIYQKFRLHKTVKEEQTTQFFHEWTNYLQHIEQTGREQSSREVGLMDSNSNINSNTTTPATAMMNNNNNESKRSSSFGRNVNQGVEFNEEQVNQLDKLKEEAVKAGGKKGGGGNGGDVIVDRYDGR